MIGVDSFDGQGNQLYGAEQAGGLSGPIRGVEFFVVVVHEVDFMEFFPEGLAVVEIADAVGGEVGDFDFEKVCAGFQQAGNFQAERVGDEHACWFSVQADAGAFADVAQIEDPAVGVSGGGGQGEGGRVAGGTGEALGLGIREICPGAERFDVGGGGHGRAAFEEGNFPWAVDSERLAGGF